MNTVPNVLTLDSHCQNKVKRPDFTPLLTKKNAQKSYHFFFFSSFRNKVFLNVMWGYEATTKSIKNYYKFYEKSNKISNLTFDVRLTRMMTSLPVKNWRPFGWSWETCARKEIRINVPTEDNECFMLTQLLRYPDTYEFTINFASMFPNEKRIYSF